MSVFAEASSTNIKDMSSTFYEIWVEFAISYVRKVTYHTA
jgi:hypothetical protein